jgi:hypothetical protein
MPNIDRVGGYTREQLEEALRSIDPEKNPGDYAAVKAAIARALPTYVGESCLDVGALRKLDALVQTSTGNRALSIATAIGITVYLAWRLLSNPNVLSQTIYWERVALAIGVAAVVWVLALWKTTTNSYRFSSGTIRCMRFGQIAWEQSLSDLVWVEEIVGRYGSSLDFHWPTSTHRVALRPSDFEQFGVVVSRAQLG